MGVVEHMIKTKAGLQKVLVSNKKIVLAIAGLIILVLIVIYPGQRDLAKLEDLYGRGQFQAARVGLEQALTKEPQWHEARALLARLELADGRPMEALEQMRVLTGFGQDIVLLERQFSRWLDSGQLDRGTAKLVVDFIFEKMEESPQWEWLGTQGFNLAFRWVPEEIPGYLLSMGEETFSQNMFSVSWGWNEALNSGDWDVAWALSDALDSLTFRSAGGQYRAHLVMHMDPENTQLWTALQAKYSGDCLAALGRASSMPGNGLEWLAEWERGNQVIPEAAEFYSAWKSFLIQGADTVQATHLDNVQLEQLLHVALADAGNKTKLTIILEFLAQNPEMAEQLGLFKLAAGAPEPDWVFTDSSITSSGLPRYFEGGPGLSEDGNHIILREGDGDFLHNLATGKRNEFPVLPLHWSPDGSKVAVTEWRDEGNLRINILQVYTDQGELLHETKLTDLTFIGWKNSSNIWLYRHGGLRVSLVSIDLANGRESKAKIPELPNTSILRVGPGGRLAWFRQRQVGVWDGTNVYNYEFEDDVSALEFSPEGNKLALMMDGQLYIQSLGGGLDHLDLPLVSYEYPVLWRNRYEVYNYFQVIERVSEPPQLLSWRNKDQLYISCPLDNNQSMLGIYNLSTGEINMTGIINPASVAGSRVLVITADIKYNVFAGNAGGGINRKLYVYDLR